MTRRVFGQWAKQEQGEDEEGTEEWWQELLADRNIERDDKGRRNELQLYVPQKARKFRKGYKFQGSRAVEGNSRSKNYKPEDMDTFQKQVERQISAYSSDWLRGSRCSNGPESDEEASLQANMSPQAS